MTDKSVVGFRVVKKTGETEMIALGVRQRHLETIAMAMANEVDKYTSQTERETAHFHSINEQTFSQLLQ